MQFHELSVDGVKINCDKLCAVRTAVALAETSVSYYTKIVAIRNIKQNRLLKRNAV